MAIYAVTRFCVASFKRDRGLLVQAEASEFYDETSARRAFSSMLRRSAGAALFTVTGEPGSGLWRRPRLMLALGEIVEPELWPAT